MSDTIVTVAVSALTSGVVALGIEWLFKPRLESRKERLLELHRKRQAFRENMVSIMLYASMWSDFSMPADASPAESANVQDEMGRGLVKLDQATQAMMDEVHDIAATFLQSSVTMLVARYILGMRALQLSDRPVDDKLSKFLELTMPMHDVLFGTKWRFVHRVKALLALPVLLDKYASVSQSESSTPEER